MTDEDKALVECPECCHRVYVRITAAQRFRATCPICGWDMGVDLVAGAAAGDNFAVLLENVRARSELLGTNDIRRPHADPNSEEVRQ